MGHPILEIRTPHEVAQIMRTAATMLVLLLAWVSGPGQTLPPIELDLTVKTSEFYAWKYDKEREIHGYGGTYWLLDNDFKLYFGQTAHSPVANSKRLVGSWAVQNDSVVLTISRPRKMRLNKPTSIRYRTFQIEWTTNTGYTEKDAGVPFILKSVAIILSDNPDYNSTVVIEKLNKYVSDNFKFEELTKEEESIRDWANHLQMERLVRQYFNLENTAVGIKQYRNNNLLWTR